MRKVAECFFEYIIVQLFRRLSIHIGDADADAVGVDIAKHVNSVEIKRLNKEELQKKKAPKEMKSIESRRFDGTKKNISWNLY